MIDIGAGASFFALVSFGRIPLLRACHLGGRGARRSPRRACPWLTRESAPCATEDAWVARHQPAGGCPLSSACTVFSCNFLHRCAGCVAEYTWPRNRWATTMPSAVDERSSGLPVVRRRCLYLSPPHRKLSFQAILLCRCAISPPLRARAPSYSCAPHLRRQIYHRRGCGLPVLGRFAWVTTIKHPYFC